LRITIVTGYFLPVPPLSGGATERSWFGLAKIFAAAGHTVTFVSRSWPGLPPVETSEGINHIRVAGFDHTSHLAVNVAFDFLWGVRVSQILPQADVVVCNTITMPAWLRLINPAAGKVAVMIGRTPKGQVGFYRGVARIYAPSSSLASKIMQPWAIRRTKTIGYPIEWSRLAAARAPASPPITIGYAGRLHPEKGIELLMRAICLLAQSTDIPEWRIRLVGPVSVKEGGGGEDWFDAIRNDCAPIVRNHVEWNGPEFDPGKLAALYGTMDIFCYPSLAEKGETFGVSVAEAMAAGCAVVVSSLGCFSDLVEDGLTGLVFDHTSKTPEQLLSDCLRRLLEDKGLRQEIAKRGQERARKFDYPEVSRVILDDMALFARTDAKNSR
jgi:glycosyltransferase involved in cell wall biosynthesis